MIADLFTFLAFAAALTLARLAAHRWSRHVAARLAEEHADEIAYRAYFAAMRSES